jgi:hypothetical protein
MRALCVAFGLVGIALLSLGTGLIYTRAPEGVWMLAIGIGCFLVPMLDWRRDSP